MGGESPFSHRRAKRHPVRVHISEMLRVTKCNIASLYHSGVNRLLLIHAVIDTCAIVGLHDLVVSVRLFN